MGEVETSHNYWKSQDITIIKYAIQWEDYFKYTHILKHIKKKTIQTNAFKFFILFISNDGYWIEILLNFHKMQTPMCPCTLVFPKLLEDNLL